MRNIIFGLIVLMTFGACSESEPDLYTGRQLEFELFKSSDYQYTGSLFVKEMTSGQLEFAIQLVGAQSNTAYEFPAHLHFGSYEQADSPIAYLLSPISAQTLESRTLMGSLSDGNTLSFEEMQVFDGHVKIHLANEGPDYGVILVAGNIGGNPRAFDSAKLAICGNSF